MLDQKVFWREIWKLSSIQWSVLNGPVLSLGNRCLWPKNPKGIVQTGQSKIETNQQDEDTWHVDFACRCCCEPFVNTKGDAKMMIVYLFWNNRYGFSWHNAEGTLYRKVHQHREVHVLTSWTANKKSWQIKCTNYKLHYRNLCHKNKMDEMFKPEPSTKHRLHEHLSLRSGYQQNLERWTHFHGRATNFVPRVSRGWRSLFGRVPCILFQWHYRKPTQIFTSKFGYTVNTWACNAIRIGLTRTVIRKLYKS